MTNDFSTELSQALWHDYDGQKAFPALRPLLAHYTSLGTLEKIVSNQEIWFSHPLHMNDHEEMMFGMDIGAAEFRASESLTQACHGAAERAALTREFDLLFQEFGAHHAFDTYVSCFSEHDPEDQDGRLSMWRGYGAGGGGAAIVFDTRRLQARESSPLVVGKVDYKSHLQRRELVGRKLHALASSLQARTQTHDVLKAAAAQWIRWLKRFALFTKHSGFREEQEWRVVYACDEDPERALAPMFGYAITARGVEPKLKLKIGSVPGIVGIQPSLEELVDRIVLGPAISTEFAVKSVCRMLELSPFPSLARKVRSSSIPFRP